MPDVARRAQDAGSTPPVIKGFVGETHRLIDPVATYERLRPLLPVLGITRIANVTGLDTIGIPVVMVCRPGSRSLSVAQGKGATLAAARASGLMEAVESYFAERITLPLKLASFNELRFSHRLVDLSRLPRSSAARFHPDRQILWIEARDLIHGAAAWLPFEVVHSNYTLPLPPTSGAFLMSSSGLAAGNHVLEAQVHSVCELVERDAVTLWQVSSGEHHQRRRLDLATVDAPICRELIERYDAADIALAAWDLTSDTGIPVFRCAIAARHPDPLRPVAISGGSGCHPDRQVALTRALTEAAQSRLTQIAGSRDDIAETRPQPEEYLAMVRRFQDRLEEPGPRRSFADCPTHPSSTFEDDLEWLLERLQGIGIEQVWAIDLTAEGFGIPVVRVVTPGLEALWDVPGFVPGDRARELMGSEQT